MSDALLTTAVAASRAGLTRRRVDYWVEQGAIRPAAARTTVLTPAFGDRQRLITGVAGWSDQDITRLRAIARIDRDLREFGAELNTTGLARLWDALEESQTEVRIGAVVIDLDGRVEVA